MPDWDEDSPQLRLNLESVLNRIKSDAEARHRPSYRMALRWQATMMEGLAVPDPAYLGAFRGSPALQGVNVRVGEYPGVDAAKVSGQLRLFDTKLSASVAELDKRIPSGSPLTPNLLVAVIDLCAWVHAEWVRIHPFANGNGRTARLWANYIAMRYGLPPFVTLRPRPAAGYGAAGAAAMRGDIKPTEKVFQVLLDDFLHRKS